MAKFTLGVIVGVAGTLCAIAYMIGEIIREDGQ